MSIIGVKKLSENGRLPTKGNITDAGWDLYAAEDVTICAGQRRLVHTDISIMIPEGYVGLIWPRSGLSVNNGIDVLAGVIDSGYTGECGVCLLNTSQGDAWGANKIEIEAGDRIAQIVFQEIPQFSLQEVQDLLPSNRGEEGFGSSGK